MEILVIAYIMTTGATLLPSLTAILPRMRISSITCGNIPASLQMFTGAVIGPPTICVVAVANTWKMVLLYGCKRYASAISFRKKLRGKRLCVVQEFTFMETTF